MKFLPLLWSSLWRKKIRTIFTLLSVFVAFLLFGLLMTIRGAFGFGVDIAGVDRLVLIHKVSLIMPLPIVLRGAAEGDRRRRGWSRIRRGSAASTRTRRTSSRRWWSSPSRS